MTEEKQKEKIEKVKEIKEQKKDLGNSILISRKPIGAYILAARRVLETDNELVIKARGRAINSAVNIAEILKRDGLKIKSISIDTEKFTIDKKEISVSSICLILNK